VVYIETPHGGTLRHCLQRVFLMTTLLVPLFPPTQHTRIYIVPQSLLLLQQTDVRFLVALCGRLERFRSLLSSHCVVSLPPLLVGLSSVSTLPGHGIKSNTWSSWPTGSLSPEPLLLPLFPRPTSPPPGGPSPALHHRQVRKPLPPFSLPKQTIDQITGTESILAVANNSI
jgi:hypothetical protein